MATFDSLKNFVLNTERIPDRVCWRQSVTYSVPLAAGISAYTEYTIAHGLPFVPQIIGTYSDDSFATSYDFGGGPFGALPTYGFSGLTMIAHAYSDATNVTIRVISHNTARTITFHLVGLYPLHDTGTHTIPTPAIQDNFLLNSDLVTLKHMSLFEYPLTTNGLGTFVSQSFTLADLSTPATSLCFITEDGKTSYMNTMNSITSGGVNFSTLSSPTAFQISVASFLTKTVTISVKTYVDA